MSKSILKMSLVALSLGLVYCAHEQVAKQVDAAVNAQPAHVQPGEVARKGLSSIEQSNSLSPEQKMKLTDLVARVRGESQTLNEQSTKLKGVLFETLTSTPYNTSQVDEVKRRLVKLNDLKMKKMFQALREAEDIIGVGRLGENREIIRDMLVPPGAREL